MPYYRSVGIVPPKRHTIVEHEGGILYEELVGAEGFSEESSLLYHRNSPSAILETKTHRTTGYDLRPDHPVEPRHLRTSQIDASSDPLTDRKVLMGNDNVTISWVSTTQASPLVRNVLGDELTFVFSGSAKVETSFGAIDVSAGNYVVMPRATTQRWIPGDDGLEALVIEAVGHVRIPERYLSTRGQLMEGAPFSERDLRGPAAPLDTRSDGPAEVLVRNRGGWTSMVHAHHPFDVVGWDGCLYPYVFDIAAFEPIVGAIHQPPPVHQTFAGPGFVVCSFVPRPFDFWPGAIKVPYHHSNIDSDEVLFYVSGDFMSRSGSGINAGSISYHPAGFVHGPQPGSLERARNKSETREVAVMIDTFAPLMLTDLARSVSDAGYQRSWLGPQASATQ
jgi:homogentisate 1,2-dioxygenase